jgi:hypothetical protein
MSRPEIALHFFELSEGSKPSEGLNGLIYFSTEVVEGKIWF